MTTDTQAVIARCAKAATAMIFLAVSACGGEEDAGKTSEANVGTGKATLNWVAPTVRDDGTPLQNLSGFRIRRGTAPGLYTVDIDVKSPSATSYEVTGLPAGVNYFVVLALDSEGLESPASAEVSKVIPK